MSATPPPRFGRRDTLGRIHRHLVRHPELLFPRRIEFSPTRGAVIELLDYWSEPHAHRPLARWAASLATIEQITLTAPVSSDPSSRSSREYGVTVLGRLTRTPGPLVSVWDILPLYLEQPMHPRDKPRELTRDEWLALVTTLEAAAQASLGGGAR